MLKLKQVLGFGLLALTMSGSAAFAQESDEGMLELLTSPDNSQLVTCFSSGDCAANSANVNSCYGEGTASSVNRAAKLAVEDCYSKGFTNCRTASCPQ